MTRRVWTAIGFGLLGLTLLTGGVHATGTATKCAAGKQKATGQAAASLLKCFGKATQKALPVVDPTCVTKAQGKFSTTFGKLDQAGGCAVTDDAKTMLPGITSWVSERLAAEPPYARCGTTVNHPPCGAALADTALCYRVCAFSGTGIPGVACMAPSNDGPCFWSADCPLGDLCVSVDADSCPGQKICARVQLR